MASKLVTALALVVCMTVAIAAEDRDFADSIVGFLIARDDASLYERVPPSAKSSLSLQQMTTMSDGLRSTFGTLKSATYWRTEKGVKVGDGGQIPITVVWYKIVTDKFEDGHALTVTLTSEGARYYLSGYHILRNMGKSQQGDWGSTGA